MIGSNLKLDGRGRSIDKKHQNWVAGIEEPHSTNLELEQSRCGRCRQYPGRPVIANVRRQWQRSDWGLGGNPSAPIMPNDTDSRDRERALKSCSAPATVSLLGCGC